ncbi:MAG: hypothetical protein ABIJ01_08115 [Pseudomonadota bacterium]
MEKEFGKLTLDQLRQLIAFLPELDLLHAEMPQIFAEKQEKLNSILTPGFSWSHFYELPIEEHMGALAIIAGIAMNLKAAVASDDPQQFLINDLKDGLQDWQGGDNGKFELKHLLSAVYSTKNTLDCLMVYGFYINEFISQLREGDDSALFKAIRMDPTVASCPTAADRISRAVMEQDEAFLHNLHKAFSGKTGDQAAYLKHFRFAMQALREGGALEKSNNELIRLVFDLGLYDDAAGSEKNVRELIRKSKKKQSI